MSGFFPLSVSSGGGGSGGTVTASYTQSFLISDWVPVGDGSFSIVIPQATHQKVPPFEVYTEELVGDIIGGPDDDYQQIVVQTDIDPVSLDIGMVVPDSGSRFTGRITIAGSN